MVDRINTLLSSRMLVDSPVSPVGPHGQQGVEGQPEKVQTPPTLQSAPHLFDTLQQAPRPFSVLDMAKRWVPERPPFSEYEYNKIMKRIGREREEKKYLNLFPELVRKQQS